MGVAGDPTAPVDLVGAELLLRVVTAFKRASHELVIVGAEQLIEPMKAIGAIPVPLALTEVIPQNSHEMSSSAAVAEMQQFS